MKSLRLLFLFLIVHSVVSGQTSIKDTSLSFSTIGITFNYQYPGADMAKRFGNNFAFGTEFQWKFKSNWIAGIEGRFFFSDHVKESSILDGFKTSDGNIIDGNGQYGTVLLYERGLQLNLKGGKILPFIGPNPNSGLMLTAAVGYLQHKIWIDTPGSPIPFLEGEYKKGYDRLSSGLALTEFIGYINFSNRKLVNFYGGLEFTQAFTKNRRQLNFDTGLKDDSSRLDLLFGIHLGWMFPLYKRVADKYYFN